MLIRRIPSREVGAGGSAAIDVERTRHSKEVSGGFFVVFLFFSLFLFPKQNNILIILQINIYYFGSLSTSDYSSAGRAGDCSMFRNL